MPTTPIISLSAVSATSFSVTVSGTDLGTTQSVYWKLVRDAGFTAGPTIMGDGTSTVTGVTANGQVQVYVVSSAGSGYSLPAFATLSLATTDSLTGAVSAYFDSQPTLVTAVPGGLFLGESPETVDVTVGPMACFTMVSEETEYYSENPYREATTLRFSFFGEGAAVVESAVKTFKAIFDPLTEPNKAEVALVLTNSKVEGFTRTNSNLSVQEVRTKDGALAYGWEVWYEANTVRAY
jgi:hypothetical protein